MSAPDHFDLEAWLQVLVTGAPEQKLMIRMHVLEKALVCHVAEERDGTLEEADLGLHVSQGQPKTYVG